MQQRLQVGYGQFGTGLLRGTHLHAADEVVPDHRQQVQRCGAQVGPQLLLQHRQQKTFRKTELEARMQGGPAEGLALHGHALFMRLNA